jgi:hypothetical protein
VDSIQNIIAFSSTLSCTSFDLLLPMLNWNGILLDRNLKYISNTKLIVSLLGNQSIPNEAVNQISDVILELMEKVLNSAHFNDDLIVKFYVYF